MMMTDTTASNQFITEIQSLCEKIKQGQQKAILAAAQVCADAIAANRWVHLFGAGHSAIPVMEAFPRIGSFVGFHPLIEPNLSFNGHFIGSMGQRQASFLEHVEGYAAAILKNHRLAPPDVIVLFSHSGINELIVEMAILAKSMRLKVIAITSVEHSLRNQPRHRSGKRLYETADLVIDTLAPEGDALISLEGLDYNVAGVSTILSCIVTNALIGEIASELLKRGMKPTVFPSHNINTTRESFERMALQEDRVYEEYRKRLAGPSLPDARLVPD